MLFFQQALAISPSIPSAPGAAGSGRGRGGACGLSAGSEGHIPGRGCSGCSPLLGAGHKKRGQEGPMERGAFGGGRRGRYGDTFKQNPKGRSWELWRPLWADGLSPDAGLRWIVEHVTQH